MSIDENNGKGKGPKVVDGGTAEFGEGSQKPDGLEGTVQAAQTDQQNSQSNIITPYEEINMKILRGEVYAYLTDISRFLAPYLVQLNVVSNDTKLAKGVLPDVQTDTLKRLLEHPSAYGPDIAKTGIYEELGFNSQNIIKNQNVVNFFPELDKLMSITTYTVILQKNPYQYIFNLPVPVRPFLSGAVTNALTKGLITRSADENWDFFKPLTTVDIIDYAKQVGELEKVANYVKAYNKL